MFSINVHDASKRWVNIDYLTLIYLFVSLPNSNHLYFLRIKIPKQNYIVFYMAAELNLLLLDSLSTFHRSIKA